MAYFFIIFILIIQGILFLGHWLLYRDLVNFLSITNPASLASLRWSLGILSLSFIAASFLAFKYHNVFVRIFYTIAAGWLGFLYFLLLACLLIWIGRLLPINRGYLAGFLLTLAIFTTIYSFINANRLSVTTSSVKLPNLPSAWQGKTAVWISDTHLGQIRNRKFAQKFTDKIMSLRPDIIFIGGDLFDGVAIDADQAINPLAGLQAPQGVYFITGNHEEFGDDTQYLQAVKKAGITLLSDKKIELDGLQIIGIDYKDPSAVLAYKNVLENLNIDPAKPSVLLKHDPTNLQIAEQSGVSLQISGHTHRAQVWPLSYVPSAVYKGYSYGLKTLGQMQVYISSGAGTWGPPIRFLTRPEIVQIRFE